MPNNTNTVPAEDYTSPEQRAAFCMGFIASSENYRQQYVALWQETLDNFTVGSGSLGMQERQGSFVSHALDSIFLKDPETHKAIMTYAAKLVRSLFGDPRGEYIQSRPVGWEDAKGAAPTVNRLMRYAMRRPGHFRTMVEAVLEMLLFGTGIVEVGWRYETLEMPVRSVNADEYGNEYGPQFDRMDVVVNDDVDLTVIDVQDFYPDPGEYRIERMKGAGKRFQTCLGDLIYKADRGQYDKDLVNKISDRCSNISNAPERFRPGIDQPTEANRRSEFHPLVGYEYWGEVPWLPYGKRAVVTIIDGELVAERPWPLADPYLPFKTLVINPTVGRFWGIAPAEVIRYDQDFADVLKELIARAIIRMVHPPIAFDPDSDIDTSQLRTWHTDMPIAVKGGPASVGTLRYETNLAGAMGVLGSTKNSMQEASGAQGGIQGEPGPSREAATAAAFRVNSAMDRPELAALLLERDCLPQIGIAILRRYQQFLGTTEDLARRVGEMPQGVWIGDILAEFDIEFVGSRVAMTRQQRLQAIQSLTALTGAIPAAAAMIPWDSLMAGIIGDTLELPDIAAEVGTAQTAQRNALLSQVFGQARPAGSPPAANAPLGALPAQLAGAPAETPQ